MKVALRCLCMSTKLLRTPIEHTSEQLCHACIHAMCRGKVAAMTLQQSERSMHLAHTVALLLDVPAVCWQWFLVFFAVISTCNE